MHERKPNYSEKTKSGRFSARITINGERIYVGTYDTKQQSREAAEREYVKRTGITSRFNIKGLRFGKLVAIKYAGLSRGGCKARWLCKCDCGNHATIIAAALRSGNTKSCGCYKMQRTKEVMTKGYGEAAFNKIKLFYKANARRKNLEFSLTDQEFKDIITSDCHYCGVVPQSFYKREFVNGNFFYNGVDRLDNNFGYTLSNCTTCCTVCNRAKSTMTYKDFLTYINRLKNHTIRNTYE